LKQRNPRKPDGAAGINGECRPAAAIGSREPPQIKNTHRLKPDKIRPEKTLHVPVFQSISHHHERTAIIPTANNCQCLKEVMDTGIIVEVVVPVNRLRAGGYAPVYRAYVR
jgi:hypothetical protein